MTNGENILSTFSNATIRRCKNKDFIYIEVEQNDKWIADFDIEWWNAEYQEPTTNNDLGVDCIDKTELLKAMDTWDKFGNDSNKGLIPLSTPALRDRYVPYVRYDDMVKCVNGMSLVTSQEPRWIPASERLPEKNMRCLVAVGQFNFTEIATYSDLMGIIDHKIFYQGDVGHDSFKNITQYVKAWMPLPTEYEGVEK